MRSAILILIIYSCAFADAVQLLVPSVENFIRGNHGKSVQVIGIDSRYGLNLEPVWRLFFKITEHRDKTIKRSYDENSACTMSGAYNFDPQKRKMTLKIYFYESGVYRGCSEEINLSPFAEQLIPEFKTRFDGSVEEQRLLFRGRLDDRISLLMESGRFPSMLRKVKRFGIIDQKFVNNNWQQQIFYELLTHRFGISYYDTASHTIRIDKNGSVVVANSKEQQFLTLVLPSREPIVSIAKTTYLAPTQNRQSYEQTKLMLPIEYAIVGKIEQFFSETYPSYFTHFIRDSLLGVFSNPDGMNVLVGSIQNNETVRYRWVTPRSWVDQLAMISSNDRKFRVSCSVREIIKDANNPFRFWTIVDQNWRTVDFDGNERYRDSGFLLVNFDFLEGAVLQSVKIH